MKCGYLVECTACVFRLEIQTVNPKKCPKEVLNNINVLRSLQGQYKKEKNPIYEERDICLIKWSSLMTSEAELHVIALKKIADAQHECC